MPLINMVQRRSQSLLRVLLFSSLVALAVAPSPPLIPPSGPLVPPSGELMTFGGVGTTVYWRGEESPPSVTSSPRSSSPSDHVGPLPHVYPSDRPRERSLFSKLKKSLSFSSSSSRTALSDKAMTRMLAARPKGAFFNEVALAVTEAPKRAIGSEVVRLPSGDVGSRVLAIMTRRGAPFYAEDVGGRVWFFNTNNGGRSFTYTGNLGEGTTSVIKSILRDEGASTSAAGGGYVRQASQTLERIVEEEREMVRSASAGVRSARGGFRA